jgi:hypothetical protein
MGCEKVRGVKSMALQFSTEDGKQKGFLSQHSGVFFCEVLAGIGRDDTLCERQQLDRVKGAGGEEGGRRTRNFVGGRKVRRLSRSSLM